MHRVYICVYTRFCVCVVGLKRLMMTDFPLLGKSGSTHRTFKFIIAKVIFELLMYSKSKIMLSDIINYTNFGIN